MTPQTEGRFTSAGCLLAFLGACFFGFLAVTAHWLYGSVAVLLISAWLWAARYRAGVAEQIELNQLREVFNATNRPLPALHRGGRYGYPAFTLVFRSRADHDAAESSGCIAAFKEFIQARYAHAGSKKKPFDADLAVDVTYETGSKT
jgi:hypothetical protein